MGQSFGDQELGSMVFQFIKEPKIRMEVEMDLILHHLVANSNEQHIILHHLNPTNALGGSI